MFVSTIISGPFGAKIAPLRVHEIYAGGAPPNREGEWVGRGGAELLTIERYRALRIERYRRVQDLRALNAIDN